LGAAKVENIRDTAKGISATPRPNMIRKYGVVNLRRGSDRRLYRIAEAPRIDKVPGKRGIKVRAVSKGVGPM
jgi:hypothetical protein